MQTSDSCAIAFMVAHMFDSAVFRSTHILREADEKLEKLPLPSRDSLGA